jgi:hypothetical protein
MRLPLNRKKLSVTENSECEWAYMMDCTCIAYARSVLEAAAYAMVI